jgi:hypothetical protein
MGQNSTSGLEAEAFMIKYPLCTEISSRTVPTLSNVAYPKEVECLSLEQEDTRSSLYCSHLYL